MLRIFVINISLFWIISLQLIPLTQSLQHSDNGTVKIRKRKAEALNGDSYEDDYSNSPTSSGSNELQSYNDWLQKYDNFKDGENQQVLVDPGNFPYRINYIIQKNTSLANKDLVTKRQNKDNSSKINYIYYPMSGNPFGKRNNEYNLISDNAIGKKNYKHFPMSGNPFGKRSSYKYYPMSGNPFGKRSSYKYYPMSGNPFGKRDEYYQINRNPYQESEDKYTSYLKKNLENENDLMSGNVLRKRLIKYYPMSGNPIVKRTDKYYPMSGNPFGKRGFEYYPISGNAFGKRSMNYYPNRKRTDKYYPISGNPFGKRNYPLNEFIYRERAS